MRRSLRIGLGVLALACIVAIVAIAIVVPRVVRQRLEDRVLPAFERACACELTIASIDVGLGGITLAGVELTERDPSRVGRHVRVDALHVSVGWLAALHGELEVGTIVVERARIEWPTGASLFPDQARATAERRSHRRALPARVLIREAAVALRGADGTILAQARIDGDVRQDDLEIDAALRLDEIVLSHRALASVPVAFEPVTLHLRGALAARTLRIHELRVRSAGVEARVHGELELARQPRLAGSLVIPHVACARMQRAIPRTLGPWIRRHPLEGTFSAALDVRLDWARPAATRIAGNVALDACRWSRVPDDVRAAASGRPADHVPLAALPPVVPRSVIVREDPGFYAHDGILAVSLVRALRTNLGTGEIRSGGSTITMQLAKNLWLGPERTLARKLDELFLAHQLETLLSKDQILERYLNLIEFGPRVFGIGAAARHYFGKDARELELAEAAFLSSVIPAPTRRHAQLCRGELSAEGRVAVQRVLEGLRWTRHIDMGTYDAAVAARLDFSRGDRSACNHASTVP